MGTVATCRCGYEFEINTPSEDEHFVWAVRSDGTRSNLGECPVVQGGLRAAITKLLVNGNSYGAGFMYQGKGIPYLYRNFLQ